MRLLALILAVFLVAACGERAQVAQGERTYQGKRDTKAWDNAPPADATSASGKWTQGDKVSWEAEIKARQLSQNEYQRIGR